MYIYKYSIGIFQRLCLRYGEGTWFCLRKRCLGSLSHKFQRLFLSCNLRWNAPVIMKKNVFQNSFSLPLCSCCNVDWSNKDLLTMTQLFSRLALDCRDRNLCSVFLKPNVEKKGELNLVNKLGKQPLKVFGFRLGMELGKKANLFRWGVIPGVYLPNSCKWLLLLLRVFFSIGSWNLLGNAYGFRELTVWRCFIVNSPQQTPFSCINSISL